MENNLNVKIYTQMIINHTKLNNRDIINNLDLLLNTEYNIQLEKILFSKFHPYFTLKLKSDERIVFNPMYLNNKIIISSLTIPSYLSEEEEESLIYCFLDEATSIIIAKYYLHPDNHFTTQLNINKVISNKSIKINENSKDIFYYAEVDEFKENRQVKIKGYLFAENTYSELCLFRSFEIVFKSGKPIKF